MSISNVIAFILPCWVVNSALNLLYPLRNKSKVVRMLDMPLDGGIFLGKHRLFGDSTTILGFLVAVLMGLLITFVDPHIPGILIAICMYAGHLIGSFIKRRFGIPGGKFLPVVDHGDGVIVTGFILLIFNMITPTVFIVGLLLTLLIYPVLCIIAFRLGLRRYPL